MTKKLRLVLIAIFAFIACACLFAGCSLKPTLDEILKDLNGKGATVDVTYFANEGSFSNGKVLNLRLKPGSKAIDIGKSNITSGEIKLEPEDAKHELVGWYRADIDPETGYPKYVDGSVYKFEYDPTTFDSTKNIAYTTKFDFKEETLEKGTHYYLVAVWKKIQTLQIVLAGLETEESIKVNTSEGTEVEYKNGDVLRDIPFEDSGNIPSPPDAVSGTPLDSTFVEYYYKDTCVKTDIVAWPVYKTQTDDGEGVDDGADAEPIVIYAQFIKGLWTVVKNSSGVRDMFQNYTEAYHYYIFDDIDCTDSSEKPMTVNPRINDSGFNCEIQGNNFTIKGLKIDLTIGRNSGTKSVSLLGNIGSHAKISNLNLEIEQVYTVSSNTDVLGGIYFAFTSLNDGAEFENLVISGSMTVTLRDGCKVGNMATNDPTNWKFGGYENDDYSGGMSVNATLVVK